MEEQEILSKSIIVEMISIVNNQLEKTGNRPDDLEVMNQILEIWSNYDSHIEKIRNSPSNQLVDSLAEINLFVEMNNARLSDEILHQIQFPFKNHPLFNNTQLELELTKNFEDIIYHLRTRVFPNCLPFDVPQLVIISSNDMIQLFLMFDESGNLIESVEGSSLIDDIKLKYNWTKRTHTGDAVIKAEYYTKSGKKEFIEFYDLSTIIVLGL
jgi:hypothetical protein